MDDELFRQFLDIEAAMCRIARTNDRDNPAQRYQRYRAWTDFVGRGRCFIDAASQSLGLDPTLLYADPRRIQF